MCGYAQPPPRCPGIQVSFRTSVQKGKPSREHEMCTRGLELTWPQPLRRSCSEAAKGPEG